MSPGWRGQDRTRGASRFSHSRIGWLLWFGLLLGQSPVVAAEQDTLTIGVLAFRGDDAAYARWSAMADYLSDRIGGHRFRILPLSLEGMSEMVAGDRLDFILTNTGNYVMLEHAFGVSRLATLELRHSREVLTQFGAVLFTRANHPSLRRLDDLPGHSMMAVGRNAFGGFQMAWREMKDLGIDPFADLQDLQFVGFPQDDIVLAVIDGRIDAGTVRSGTIERMAADGAIDLDGIRVLGARNNPQFPFLHSTRLYPEWPFAKSRNTPEDLAQRVAIALLQMDPDSRAARQSFAAGWTIALDYGPVHELFRELEIGPYAYLSKPNPGLIWREYRGWILFILFLLSLLLAMFYLVLRAAGHRREQRHQAQLAHIARVNSMGEMAAGIAHELNQPLTAVLNYANGCTRLLKKDHIDGVQLQAALDRLAADARRAADIIRSLREFVARDKLRQRDLSIRECIEPALQLLRSRLRQCQIQVDLNYESPLADIHADRIQIEQVVVNLLLNAIDALQEDSGKPSMKQILVEVYAMDTRYIAVAISDSGPALSDAIAAQLFDPFFTTKPEGMGMGLSISRSIIESHGGTIEYLQNERQQPTIRFTLPIA